MGELVVVAFKEPYMADAALEALKELDKDCVLDVEDSALVVKQADGTVSIDKDLEASSQLSAAGALYFGFVGAVSGWIFAAGSMGGALFGLQAGAVLGAIFGAISGQTLQIGIPKTVIKDLADSLKAGTSALCVQAARPFNNEKVIEELKKCDAELLSSSLAPKEEAGLKKALAA